MGFSVRELKSGKSHSAGIIPPQDSSRIWALFPIKQTLGDTINIGCKQVCGNLELWDRGGEGAVNVSKGGNPVEFQSVINNETVKSLVT